MRWMHSKARAKNKQLWLKPHLWTRTSIWWARTVRLSHQITADYNALGMAEWKIMVERIMEGWCRGRGLKWCLCLFCWYELPLVKVKLFDRLCQDWLKRLLVFRPVMSQMHPRRPTSRMKDQKMQTSPPLTSSLKIYTRGIYWFWHTYV